MIKKENVKQLLELMHYSTNDNNVYIKCDKLLDIYPEYA